ncbi:hypothetical protein [Thermococcus sp.]|uniref:hypothetical protein n=1 Tax=Thermococcus sp. TaxID=35749 RepID=UPI00261F6DDF|nr:hypothetical protein [Thermococcus sp.]
MELQPEARQQRLIHNQPKPEHNIGLGTVIFTWLKGDAIISEGHTWVPGISAYVKTYKVRHNGMGTIHVSVFKWIPLGGYVTMTVMPNMTTYNFYGEHFKRDYIHSYEVAGHSFKVLVAHYDSWLNFGGWWEQEVKFNAGYGRHGIITVGMTEWPILDSLLERIGVKGKLTKAGKRLLDFVSDGSGDALADTIGLLLSGLNIDAAIFTEV